MWLRKLPKLYEKIWTLPAEYLKILKRSIILTVQINVNVDIFSLFMDKHKATCPLTLPYIQSTTIIVRWLVCCCTLSYRQAAREHCSCRQCSSRCSSFCGAQTVSRQIPDTALYLSCLHTSLGDTWRNLRTWKLSSARVQAEITWDTFIPFSTFVCVCACACMCVCVILKSVLSNAF